MDSTKLLWTVVIGVGVLSVPGGARSEEDYQLYEFPQRPAPTWVKMVDQGDRDERLRGIRTPAGIRVEVIAEQPVVVNPVDLSFDDAGRAYVLEWLPADSQELTEYEVEFQDGTAATVHHMDKTSRDVLKRLVDDNGDGVYDRAEVVLDDLLMPSSTTFFRNSLYIPAIGRVVRWKRSSSGGGFTRPETIVRGLCGFHHHQASGVAVSHDGWLYITSGDDDNRAEGSDGSRATVLRTGAVFRCRPDGSQVTEFARGFRNPYRTLAQDETFNLFHADNDNEDGSKFQGVRLMHVLEGADFGWRLQPGAVCCISDHQRGAVWGESPGKVPAMVKTGRGAPAGLLIYNGTAMPEFVRGLLIYPDAYRKTVRAYRVRPTGSTFEVVEQFELMQSDHDLFRPCEAVMGPDGAIYICDWATNSGGAGRLWGDGEHGRIYRLTWAGNQAAAPIRPGPMNAWARIPEKSDKQLAELLDRQDIEQRKRAVTELVERVRQGKSDFSFAEFALGDHHSTPGRAAAIGGLCRLLDAERFAAVAKLLGDPDPDLRRLAANAVNHHLSESFIAQERLGERFSRAPSRGDWTGQQLVDRLAEMSRSDSSAAVRRAAALALGRVAALEATPPELVEVATGALLLAYRQANPGDPHLCDGYVRALESVGAAAMDSLGEMALSGDAKARATAVSVLECMRSRPLAKVLDAILEVDGNELSEAQLARLLVAYRNITVEPPVSVAAIEAWLGRNPTVAPSTGLAAVMTIGLAAEMRGQAIASEAMRAAAERLLAVGDEDFRVSTIRVIGDAGLKPLVGQLTESLADCTKSTTERRAIVTALGKLRAEPLPFGGGMSQPGVETVLDELVDVIKDPRQEAVRVEALQLLAAVEFDRAEPLASGFLGAKDASLVAGAIRVLGADIEWAKRIAERLLAGTLEQDQQIAIESVLRQHLAGDDQAPVAALLDQIVADNPASNYTQDQLLRQAAQGDPKKGRELFFSERTQCSKCHQISQQGGNIGPNLTGVWQSHSPVQLIESILEPSKEIKEGYATWTVMTDAGRVYSGLKLSDTDDAIVLRNDNGEDIRIPADSVDEKFASEVSLMPEGTVTKITLTELADLIAFLKSRQEQESL